MNKITVSIVEDENHFQKQILNALEKTPAIECLSIHSTSEDALEKIPHLDVHPDIVIMDLILKGSGKDGIGCMFGLRLELPKTKYLILTNETDESKIFKALKYGAGAYIDKGEIYKDLSDIIIEFYNGGKDGCAPMSPGIAQKVVSSFHSPTKSLKLLEKLSETENRILGSLSKGKMYKEIAGELGIPVTSIKYHCHQIYKKLEVNSRAEAEKEFGSGR